MIVIAILKNHACPFISLVRPDVSDPERSVFIVEFIESPRQNWVTTIFGIALNLFSLRIGSKSFIIWIWDSSENSKKTVRVENSVDFLKFFVTKCFHHEQKSVLSAIFFDKGMTYQPSSPPWAIKTIARIFIPWFEVGVFRTNCLMAFLTSFLVTCPFNLIFISNPWQFFENLYFLNSVFTICT